MSNEYIKKEDIFPILQKSMGDLSYINYHINNLKTYTIQEPEFKVGDEVWYIKSFDEKNCFMPIDKIVVKDTIKKIIKKIKTKNYKDVLNNGLNPYILYKSKEEVEQALKELNKDGE